MNAIERNITRTFRIAAERPTVFRALMDPGTLSRWLFATVTMTPELGSSFQFEWKDSQSPATAQGEILELVPDERLVLSWFMESDGVTSTASFELADAPEGGTILRFVQSGLPQEPEWRPRCQAVALEWDKVLLNLVFMLEEKGEGKHLFYFRTQFLFHANIHRLFHAWTTSTGLGSWMARDVFVIPEEGRGIEGVTRDTGRALAAGFLRIDPHRHLRMIWSEGGKRGIVGVSLWPSPEGVTLTLTLRSFALMEGERPIVQALWDGRFKALQAYLERSPLSGPVRGTGTLTFTRNLEVPASRAWNALTDAALLRRWFANWTDFEPRVGAPCIFLFDSYGEDQGRVEEVGPGERIRFTWDIPALGETTAVTVKVDSEPGQPALCRVTLEHSGWGEGEEWNRQKQAHESGWSSMLALLDFYLRCGAGKERRDFHLRRRLPLPLERAVPLFTTAAGLQSWAATRASIEPRVGGAFELQLQDGALYKGRVVSVHSSGDGAAELESPQPAFLEWGFAPESEGSRIGISLTVYGGTEEWMEARRGEWVGALARLGANGPPA